MTLKYKLAVYIRLLLLISLQSCGTDTVEKRNLFRRAEDANPRSGDLNSAGSTVRFLASAAELPTCAAGLKSLIYYVADNKEFRSCDGTQWIPLELKAITGAEGRPGRDGISALDLREKWQSLWQKNILNTAVIICSYGDATQSVMAGGTGFVVGQNLVATNGHVVAPTTPMGTATLPLRKIDVWFPNLENGDTRYSTTPNLAKTATQVDRQIATTDDLALVQVDTGTRPSLPLSERNEASDYFDESKGVSLGEQVLLLGYSGLTEFAHYSLGNITAIQPVTDLLLKGFISNGKLVYEYDLESGGGSSGGPVLDQNGQVIAVNFAGYTGESDLSFGYALQVKHLKNLLALPRQWIPVP